MNKKIFKKAMIEYSKESQIAIYQLGHYLTDARLIGILKIYDKLNKVIDEFDVEENKNE